MPGIAMKPEIAAELQRQMNQELSSAHAYLAVSVWCDEQNFKGFARYFSKQAFEERVHAQKFVQHLLDRGVLAVLAAIPAPKVHFSSLLEVAKQAQAMEQANTVGINACYAKALSLPDYPAQVFLKFFISEQVEEENWADEMVDRVQRASCAGAEGDLDRHIERYLGEEGANAAASEK